MSALIRTLALNCAVSLAACASDNGRINLEDTDEDQPIFLDCSDGWASGTSAANKICGSRGFDEIDRMQDTHLSATGALEDLGDGHHIIKDELRHEGENQAMIIRCR